MLCGGRKWYLGWFKDSRKFLKDGLYRTGGVKLRSIASLYRMHHTKRKIVMQTNVVDNIISREELVERGCIKGEGICFDIFKKMISIIMCVI
jgi:hypothetical protein